MSRVCPEDHTKLETKAANGNIRLISCPCCGYYEYALRRYERGIPRQGRYHAVNKRRGIEVQWN